jgi:hypothetical protein
MFVFESLLIVVFLLVEAYVFFRNCVLIARYSHLFPTNEAGLNLDKDSVSNAPTINSSHSSKVFQNIIYTLNRYLNQNSNQVSDYHLMRDVVERNREMLESQITTQIPYPQYIGLIGTMFGIVVGVYTLVLGDGLENLMSGQSTALSDSGVPDLLGGVGLAMVTSVFGLGFTMYGSNLFKKARTQVEANQNTFLSWIQAELLPNLSTDMVSTLGRMALNLQDFNKTFSANTLQLDKTLAKVNESYKGQAKILEAIERTNITRVVSANIEVYDKLKSCTDEIGELAVSLRASRDYLQTVQELTTKLDGVDERTKTWEKMARFFETEIKEIEQRKAAIASTVGSVDLKLTESINELNESSKNRIKKMADAVDEQNQMVKVALEKQGGELKDELNRVAGQISEYTQKLTSVFDEQNQMMNRSLNEMSSAIESRNHRLGEVINRFEKMVDEFPNQMERHTSQLSNLSAIKDGIHSLQRTMSQMGGYGTPDIDIPTPVLRLPKSVKQAILVLVVCNLLTLMAVIAGVVLFALNK